MHKRTLLGVVVFLAFAAFAALPVVAQADGAVVIKDIGCNLFDGNGNLTFTDSSIAVSNDGGVTVLKCSAKDLPNDSGAAAHFDFDTTGVGCGTPGGFTLDWRNTVSASGNSTLTCRVQN